MIRIRPQHEGRAALREAWRSRELLISFVERELKVRHKDTLLGPIWIVVQPLLFALVFAVFLHRLAGVPSNGYPYVLFALSGVLPWTFFANGVQSLSYGLLMNAHLVSRVYFPRVVIPLSMVLVRLVDFTATILVFLTLCALMGVKPSLRLLLLPMFAMQACVLTLAVGAWSSTFLPRYRDFGTLLPVLLQFGLFASPVVYPSSVVPEDLRPLYYLNPMAAVIDGVRASVFGDPLSVPSVLVSLAVTFVVCAHLFRHFGRMEQRAVEAL